MDPLTMIRMIRRLRATAAHYLDRCGLERPSVPWREYGELEARNRS
jgi:hypothetical protein